MQETVGGIVHTNTNIATNLNRGGNRFGLLLRLCLSGECLIVDGFDDTNEGLIDIVARKS